MAREASRGLLIPAAAVLVTACGGEALRSAADRGSQSPVCAMTRPDFTASVSAL